MILSITTFIIFTVWTYLTTLISQHPFWSVIAACLISLGIYRTLATLLLEVFRNISFIKKWILGPYFMEGTWVGFFVGHNNKIRLFCEIFEQDLSDLVVKGKAFKEDGSYYGYWNSDSVNINVRQGTLSYTYNADVIGNTSINPGLARFNLERSSKNKSPHRMFGYSSDLFSPKKLKAFEDKISDSTDLESADVFAKAKEILMKYKDHI
ncbi:hypothetical protein ACFL4D_02715 [Candidatus Margulisiibacteriota bacterium]